MDSKEKYMISVKTVLLHRQMTITELAHRIGRSRRATSGVIHGAHSRFAVTKKLIDQELGITNTNKEDAR